MLGIVPKGWYLQAWSEPGQSGKRNDVGEIRTSLIMQSIVSDGQDPGLYFKCDRKPRSYTAIFGGLRLIS